MQLHVFGPGNVHELYRLEVVHEYGQVVRWNSLEKQDPGTIFFKRLPETL